MRVATREERDKLLHLSDALLDQLRLMHASHAATEEMITYMESIGVPKAGATVALRLSRVMTLGDAKVAVHFSQAYAYRREADEMFEESAVQALHEIDQSEAAA